MIFFSSIEIREDHKIALYHNSNSPFISNQRQSQTDLFSPPIIPNIFLQIKLKSETL